MTGLLGLQENKNKAIQSYRNKEITREQLYAAVKEYVDEKNRNNRHMYKYGITKEDENADTIMSGIEIML